MTGPRDKRGGSAVSCAMVDLVTVFEAVFVLCVAVLPLLGVIALVRHQFWGQNSQERWLGNKKYFWFYVITFTGLTAATVFTVTARALVLLMTVGGDVIWADVGVAGSVAARLIVAIYASLGFVGSALFAIAARYAHVGGDKSKELYTVMATWHLLTYVVSFLAFVTELTCIALLSYGQYRSFNNTFPFWFTLPFPVFLAGFLALSIWNRAHPSPSLTDNL